MTVSYSFEIANAELITPFRILFKWRGSVFKFIWKELLIYFIAYYIITAVYRFAPLSEDHKKAFEELVIFCSKNTSSLPVTFILGFYVTVIFTRWNNVFNSIPWPDQASIYLSSYLNGKDDASRLYRRTVARYLVAAEVLVFRDISMAVRKRFATLDSVVQAGLLNENERACYDALDDTHSKYWVPVQWAVNIVVKARSDGKIDSDFLMNKINQTIMEYRSNLGSLMCYDWVCIPLVYTQVVSLATWSYFLACLFGKQYLDPTKKYDGFTYDFYFPPFLLLQFIFFIGWLKVAECMLNPMGEDDDDFELNSIIDRNLQVAFMQLDDNCGMIPDLKPDDFWGKDIPDLPYTEASAGKSNPITPSCSHRRISKKAMKLVDSNAVSRRNTIRSRGRPGGSALNLPFNNGGGEVKFYGGQHSAEMEEMHHFPPRKRSKSDDGIPRIGAYQMNPAGYGREAVPDRILTALAEDSTDFS